MKSIQTTLVASLCIVAALTSGTALAQDKTAAASDSLDKFVGSGTCTGNVLPIGERPGHVTIGKYHGEKTLNGHWVVVHYDEDRTAANPKPFHVIQYFGYDAEKKRYVAVGLFDGAASFSVGTSTGWQSGSIAFDEGEGDPAKPAAFRDTFTNGDSGISSHTGMMLDKSGKWVKTDEETCKHT